MQVIARRVLLAGAGTAAVASLAVALLLRKPAPRVLLLPESEPAPRLQGMAALQRLSPHPAPAIGFGDASGARHTLANFAGKGVVLNVWATWCAPCVAEMPALAALAARVAGDGILVVPLSIDHGGADAVRRFYDTHGIKGLGIWTDPDGDAGRALGVAGVPTTFVIDRKGREVAQLQGPAEWGSDAALASVRGLVG